MLPHQEGIAQAVGNVSEPDAAVVVEDPVADALDADGVRVTIVSVRGPPVADVIGGGQIGDGNGRPRNSKES